MKKILLILTVLVFSPLATQAENALNTDEAFQVARVFKLGRESANSGFQDKNIYRAGSWKKRQKEMDIKCGNGLYYKASTHRCVPVCTDVVCKEGKTAHVENVNSCCCR